jgi:transcriptional regulator with XRE-family HTH domain
MNPEWFAGRLRELREAAGLTQTQLADKAGMKLGGVQNLEQGRTYPTWPTVLALAEALGVTCEAFTRPPAEREPVGPGRPPKEKDDAEASRPRRPRGRPRKGSIGVEVGKPKRPGGRPRKGAE